MNREDWSPTVSIIIPIYNDEVFLRETISSVLSQTFSDYELILVDDGSTDNSIQIVNEYKRRDSRIVYLHKDNSGLSDTRYMGYVSARGKFVLFLDHDDVFSPCLLEQLVKYASETNIVYAGAENMSNSGISAYEWTCTVQKDIEKVFSGKEVIHELYQSSNYSRMLGALWGVLMPKSFLDSLIPTILEGKASLPITYFEDVYLAYRIFWDAKTVSFLNETLILHRVHKNALSRTLLPTKYGYELLHAEKMKLEFWHEKKETAIFDRQLIHYYMAMLKIWWQAISYETDENIKRQVIREVLEEYDKYYKYMSRIKPCDRIHHIYIVAIRVFHISPRLWKVLIGDWWFKRKYNKDFK